MICMYYIAYCNILDKKPLLRILQYVTACADVVQKSEMTLIVVCSNPTTMPSREILWLMALGDGPRDGCSACFGAFGNGFFRRRSIIRCFCDLYVCYVCSFFFHLFSCLCPKRCRISIPTKNDLHIFSSEVPKSLVEEVVRTGEAHGATWRGQCREDHHLGTAEGPLWIEGHGP